MGEIGNSFSQNRSKTKSTRDVEETPLEQQLNQMQFDQYSQLNPQVTQANQLALALQNALVSGGSLPGFYNKLPGGISEDVTSSIVQKSIGDIRPGLQANGLYDSGIRAELEARTASDIRRQAEEYNQNLLQNLLSMALGGASSLQAPALGISEMLGNRLSGLRTIQDTGKGRQWGQESTFKTKI